MLRFALSSPDRCLRKVLVIGAHADDIEIGCGGTLIRLIADYEGLEFLWVVLSGNAGRADEARRSAEAYLGKVQGRSNSVLIGSFRDGYFPYSASEVKDLFESSLKRFNPELILTHYRMDLHQDHRLLSELTWNTFREHLILEYEIPKYDGDLGSPNVYVHLETAQAERKVRLLFDHFRSQQGKHWFAAETFLGLMRLRGMECRAPSGYAEGFYGRKLIV